MVPNIGVLMSQKSPKDWIPPDYLNLTERSYLVDRAETINGIVAHGYIKCGQVLLQVKRHFKSDPDLDGWFYRWINECLPFSRSKAISLVRIAEQAESDPLLLSLVDSQSYDKLYRIICLPDESRKDLLGLLSNGDEFNASDVESFRKEPEIVLEKAQEYAEEIQMKLLELELSIPGLTGAKREDALDRKNGGKARLKKALLQLQTAREKVSELEKVRTSNEILTDIMKKKVQAQSLVIENLTLDPEQKRKRALAQTVVDATKGLDLLLSSLDRYDTDKPELGIEAVKTIELKMDEVKRKLMEHYASNTASNPYGDTV
jgi:hypothetical protein